MEDCRRHQLREQAIERPKMTQVDKNFVATGQLSAVDGMGPSPIATAGAVEHFAVIRKMARLGTINRALIEPVAAGCRRARCARSNDAYIAEHQCLWPELLALLHRLYRLDCSELTPHSSWNLTPRR